MGEVRSTVDSGLRDKLRGKFIVFDGPEGCGKSTQAQLLLRELQDQHVPALLNAQQPLEIFLLRILLEHCGGVERAFGAGLIRVKHDHSDSHVGRSGIDWRGNST